MFFDKEYETGSEEFSLRESTYFFVSSGYNCKKCLHQFINILNPSTNPLLKKSDDTHSSSFKQSSTFYEDNKPICI